jgi:hypothetical protein
MADTTYIVLRQHNANGTETRDKMPWEIVGHSETSTPNSAIREVTSNLTEGGGWGMFVAVPARSWKPVTVTTETRTVLKLEQPDTAP